MQILKENKPSNPRYYSIDVTLSAKEVEFLHRLFGNHIIVEGSDWRDISSGVYEKLFNVFGYAKSLPTERTERASEGIIKLGAIDD